MSEPEEIEALRSLSRGDYAGWQGLRPGLERSALDQALGGGAGPEHSGQLAGMPATYREYPATEGAPFGLRAWFSGDLVATIEIREPQPPAPLDELLGDPETRVPSGLGGSYSQWVYAERGLAAHVSRVTGQVRRLYAFPASPTETFLAHPLSRVERRRVRRS